MGNLKGLKAATLDDKALRALSFVAVLRTTAVGRKWGRSDQNRYQTRRKAPGQFRM